MAISNLSSQYISSSFQNLMQISSSNAVYNGSGTQVTTLLVSASYATTSSYALNAAAGSQGAIGPQGTFGAAGAQGAIGSQGTQGTQGNTGAGTQGVQGTIGIQGVQGSSTGVPGAQGAAGAQGATGAAGSQGAVGSLSYTSYNTGILWDNSGTVEAGTSPITQTGVPPNGVWTGDAKGTIDLTILGTAAPGQGLIIPTTIPGAPTQGSMYVDFTANRLKIFDGATWRLIAI